MASNRFIEELELRNFLSYGNHSEPIELQSLNVLIGSNTSGKSNLIEAFSILQATPTDLRIPIRKGGGIDEFIWKGKNDTNEISFINAKITNNSDTLNPNIDIIEYYLVIDSENQKILISDELICWFDEEKNETHGIDRTSDMAEEKNEPHEIDRTPDMPSDKSMLSQRKDPINHPEITYLANQFSQIGIYRDFHIGYNSIIRMPQSTDLPEHPLLEDGSNLGLVLNDLQYQIGNRKIIDTLKKFYEKAEELIIKVYGGTVQIFIREEGLNQPISVKRLSDGTLHYLLLMALLLDPNPPPLLCIEEPEIGLHPDILPTIAEMLIEASQRTQIIITTHSDALVSALPPESILVCERDEEGTKLTRLDADKLKDWLENYSLGDLWRMGEIGGNP